MITSQPFWRITSSGVLYCCPIASPLTSNPTPGVKIKKSSSGFASLGPRPRPSIRRWAINPMTNSLLDLAIRTASSVYSPRARVPLVLISASNRSPRPRGRPTAANPEMTDGPGTGCALVMWDQLAILCTPLEYCRATVFPVVQMA